MSSKKLKKLINPLIYWVGREGKEKKRKGPGSATRPASEPLKASGVAYPPRTLGRVPGCVTLITTQPGTRIKSLSMRVGFPEWIYSLGCPGTAEDRSKKMVDDVWWAFFESAQLLFLC